MSDRRRRSRSRDRDRRRSSSRRRSDDRRRSPGRGRSGDRRRSPPRRGGEGSSQMDRIPPPKPKAEPEEGITLEQRQNSVEHNGHLYAVLGFISPAMLPESSSPSTLQKVDLCRPSQESEGLVWATLPPGWELAQASEELCEKVIKPHPWGTHLIVTVESKAYQTSTGARPGGLEMLWDFDHDKGKNAYKLQKKAGYNSKWHGRLLIKSKVAFTSS
eukprot:TRINITY_DN2107_c0_g1_i1.p1 TRINITY_DN2107_c0_g1~~TRINITY_DN2107_c0_g1_i1.p1  ORF type:complete len:228 (+),score=35.20 TRINITY_DN2107_c0_g1_i1:38-685(+)